MNNRTDGQHEHNTQHHMAGTDDPSFDILEWHPAHQSCQRYFLDIAQYEPGTQSLCALINIRLPFQWLDNPLTAYSLQSPHATNAVPLATFAPTRPSNTNNLTQSRASAQAERISYISLIPYIRRLVVTGFDKPAILHGLFGDDYVKGVLPHVDCERRNYLFSAKAGGWRSCKKQYDMGSAGGGDETVPFMKPLDETRTEELMAAEKAWSEWLAMEDWMVGPRAPQESLVAEQPDVASGGILGMEIGAADVPNVPSTSDFSFNHSTATQQRPLDVPNVPSTSEFSFNHSSATQQRPVDVPNVPSTSEFSFNHSTDTQQRPL